MMEFPERIHRLRTEAQMTQEELAARLCVTRQAVSNWETGKTQPDFATLQKLAEAFGVDAAALLGSPAQPVPNRDTRRFRNWFFALLPLSLAALFGMNALNRFTYAYAGRTYDTVPRLLFFLVVHPLAFCLYTVTALLGLSLLADISIPDVRARRVLLIAGIALFLFFIWATCYPWLTFLPLPPVNLYLYIGDPLIKTPAFYILPTACVFFGLNKKAG